jgi:DNA-binding NarL/FixJ family response regulator
VDDLGVLIIAYDPLARAGLAALMSDPPGCTVVVQVTGYSDLSADLEAFHPDALLWDLGWDAMVSLENLADLPES